MPGLKILPDYILDVLRVECLAREHVDICVTRLVTEVSRDVRGFYELYERITGLVTGAEMLYCRLSIRNHVNSIDEGLGESDNVVRAGDHHSVTRQEVDQKVLTPRM